MSSVRLCQRAGCGKPLPPGRRKFCSNDCLSQDKADRMRNARQSLRSAKKSKGRAECAGTLIRRVLYKLVAAKEQVSQAFVRRVANSRAKSQRIRAALEREREFLGVCLNPICPDFIGIDADASSQARKILFACVAVQEEVEVKVVREIFAGSVTPLKRILTSLQRETRKLQRALREPDHARGCRHKEAVMTAAAKSTQTPARKNFHYCPHCGHVVYQDSTRKQRRGEEIYVVCPVDRTRFNVVFCAGSMVVQEEQV